eukprot:GEZU01021715.1.p1 GENE.GEZU01021715.1~~GEZU01021715.1.p1  ORF type:complete len:838 (+),score=194.35 GEZU01021715.1:69-2582(+)
MGGFGQQILPLLYKNALLLKRDKKFVLMAVAFPIFIGLFVAFISVLMSFVSSVATSLNIALSWRTNLHSEFAYVVKNEEQRPQIEAYLKYMSATALDNNVKFINFTSREEVDAYSVDSNSTSTVPLSGGLVFDNFNYQQNQFEITLMYNNSQAMTLPSLLQTVVQTLQNSVATKNHEPSVNLQAGEQSLSATDISAVIFLSLGPLLITYGVVFFIPIFTQQVVLEKEKKLKHQLIMSSVSLPAYWTSRMITDFSIYLIAMLAQLTPMLIARVSALTNNTPFAYVTLYLMFGFNAIAMSYMLSFIFQKAETASRWVSGVLSFAIIVPYLVITLLFQNNVPTVVNILLSLVPSYSVYYGISVLGRAVAISRPVTLRSMLTFSGYGAHISWLIIILAVEMVLFTVAIYACEAYIARARRPSKEKFADHEMMTHNNSLDSDENDSDVKQETERILGSSNPTGDFDEEEPNRDILRIINVSKVYPATTNKRTGFRLLSRLFRSNKANNSTVNKNKVAVNNFCLGVQAGECLGLLGPNGAGKTTLIECLTGGIPATSGEAFINSYSIFKQPSSAFKNIGVCAQFDRLYDTLTGREHLKLFAWLRGIDKRNIDAVVNDFLHEFNLTEHADKQTQHYSGGNKRKLSVALAFMGNPQVVFLDEPSTGMDPNTRRKVWDRIIKLRENRVVILTTHFMEEADALCTRIGIMVNGSLRCLGSAQHLKNKYGGGYRLSMTTTDHLADRALGWVTSTFSKAKVLTCIGGTMHFEIPQEDHSLAHMFRVVEANKRALGVIDYSISQTTLEQVFMNFAKAQIEDEANGNQEQKLLGCVAYHQPVSSSLYTFHC